MDVLTHALVPYAAALAALGLHARGLSEDRAKLAWCAIFGIAGAAPDGDALFSWMSRAWDSAYFLQHRGVSHTLVGAPLFGLAAAGLLALAARRWPARLGLFAWRGSFVLAAILGAWMHLALDTVTLSGTPLLWPFADGRVSTQTFSWLVWWLFPVSGLVLLLHLTGRIGPRGVVRGGAVVVAILVVLGGVRLVAQPPAQEGELAFPRSSELEWTIIKRLPNGSWEASLYRLGERSDPVVYASRVPAAAAAAVEKARETDSYKGFQMQNYGPIVTRAEAIEKGGWRVAFTDVAARYEATHGPNWTPARIKEEWGLVVFDVANDGRVSIVTRGW